MRLTLACNPHTTDYLDARLNFQHNLAVSVSNGLLLHPSIPVSRIKNVADVGTGTGYFLSDVLFDAETELPQCLA